MIELPIDRLPRNQRQRVQGDEFDDLAESLVAEEYGLSELTDADWYDCVDRDSNVKYEVKSTSSEINSSRYRARGRFRLWQDQHRSMAASQGANGVGWYAFVLLELDEGVIRIQRRKPSTVTRIVNDRGGWGPSARKQRSAGQTPDLVGDAIGRDRSGVLPGGSYVWAARFCRPPGVSPDRTGARVAIYTSTGRLPAQPHATQYGRSSTVVMSCWLHSGQRASGLIGPTR